MPPAASRAPASTVAVTSECTLARWPFVDERAERDLAGRRVADRQPVRVGGQRVHIGVRDPFVHEVPARGHADLALVQEGAPRAGRHRAVEVGIVEDRQRRVAAAHEMGGF